MSVLHYADDITKYYTHEKQKIFSKNLQIGIGRLEKGAINGKNSSTWENQYTLFLLDKY